MRNLLWIYGWLNNLNTVQLQDRVGQRRSRVRRPQTTRSQHTVRHVCRRLGQSHESHIRE